MEQSKDIVEDTSQLDAAGKSLSEAFRISFVILKIIMFCLVVIFLASGFKTVGSDEQALVLRFGKIRGIGEGRLLGPGLHWILPYPIDEIIKIPVAKKINLSVKSLWYYQKRDETLPESPVDNTHIPQALNPVRDGYCLTRGSQKLQGLADSTGSDHNIVHSKWQLTYKINNPERFFRNIYLPDVMPGQSYADLIAKGVKPLLNRLVTGSVVTVMVNYTIDEAIASQAKIPAHVKKLLQKRLDEIDSGLTVVSLQLTDIAPPRQVNYAFQASIRASQAKQKTISQAKGYAENTINEAGGPVALDLLRALKQKNNTEEHQELLWSQLAGQAQETIAGARAYRTKIVEIAKANAEYLQQLLPQYLKRPKLVVQTLYQDAIEYVLNNADEKIIIQPSQTAKGREIRVLLNRDPAIKQKKQQQEGSQ
ncbi:MAG: protease modulator HflK [Planctomycetota bacterium]|jgi:membrane protease subunit HflK